MIFAALFLSACSETVREAEEEEEDKVVVPPVSKPPVIPEPDWADNEMSVTIRADKTGKELLNEMRRNKVRVGRGIDEKLLNPDFPIVRTPYAITVSLITMEEMGLGFNDISEEWRKGGVPTEEIKKRIKELGYQFFTLQEGIELRIQLDDQPDSSTGHPWCSFYALPEKDEDVFCVNWNCMFHMFRYKSETIGRGTGIILGINFDFGIRPDDEGRHATKIFTGVNDVLWGAEEPDARFAVITDRKYD